MGGDLVLRGVLEPDLPIFFEQQLDEEANWMAAFTAADPADRDAFRRKWARILGDERITAPGTGRGFANARGEEVEELIVELSAGTA